MRTSYTGTRPAAIFGEQYVQSTGRQVDWDQIPDSYRQGAVKVTIGANAAQNDTTVTLNVTSGATLAKGTVLYFGTGKYLRLTQAVTGTGANVANITVEALVTALVAADVAYHGGNGPKFIPAMTVMAQLSGGKVVPYSLATVAFTATAAAKATNTGNGVLTLAGTPAIAATARAGVYRVVFIEPTTNLGTFIVEDPLGAVVAEGVVGTAFSNQVAFTIADGSTDFIAGDAFTITVVQSDGSVCAGCIITDATNGSLTDASTGYGMVTGAVVFENLLPDAVSNVLPAALKAALRGIGQWNFETYADTRS